LQTRGDVDDIAGDHPLAFLRTSAQYHDGLTRVDTDADLQRESGICLVQLLDHLQDAKPSPDRALGVVLVRRWCAEHGHDCVTDELLHRPSVALELATQACV